MKYECSGEKLVNMRFQKTFQPILWRSYIHMLHTLNTILRLSFLAKADHLPTLIYLTRFKQGNRSIVCSL